MDRVQFILNVHALWIRNNMEQRHQELNHGLSVREIIEDRLSANYSYTRFLTDYRTVCGIKKDFVSDKGGECDVEQCVIMKRNGRNRSFYGKNDNLRNEMYFIESTKSMINEAVDDEDISRDIATQQILDSLHSYFYHSVHFEDGQLDDNVVEDEDDEMENEIDFQTLCDDHSADKLVKMVEDKRNGSKRFRSRRRGGVDDNGVQQNDHQKFVTTNEFESGTSAAFSAVLGKKKLRSFRTVFISEMKRIGVNEDAIESLIDFMDRQHYETDAMVGDLDDVDDSNLTKIISDGDGNGNNVSVFREMTKRMILERSLKSSLYSPGVRYLYWNIYRGNKEKRRKVFQARTKPAYEENRGYTLGQWFVEKKYENLKEEILNNLVLALSARQFAVTLQKAMDKLSEWRDRGKQPRCVKIWWRESYGIAEGDEISVEHIVAILLYTNFSDLCYLFSATYRKTHEYEEDEDMLLRHREYGNWGKLLREAVECFGTSMGRSSVKTFFHGVSSTLIFNSTSIRLCGPVSTTCSMFTISFHSISLPLTFTRSLCPNTLLYQYSGFHIASTIFGSGGLVLSLINDNSADSIYFNCTPWSDFVDEDEKLFIGGLTCFDFKTIRNMSTTPVANYKLYIEAMTMFHYMVEAWPWITKNGQSKILKRHSMALELLVSEETERKYDNPSESVVPRYVLLLWHHFLRNMKCLELNWTKFTRNSVKGPYSHLSPIFRNEDESELFIEKFINILPNIESVYVFKWYNGLDPLPAGLIPKSRSQVECHFRSDAESYR